MLLGSTRYVRALREGCSFDLSLNGVPIELINKAVNLDIHFSPTLSWDDNIKNISSRVNGTLWRLKHYKNCLTIPLRVQLVSSLIFPLFDYCAALFTDLTGQQKLKLRRLMNACLRFIFNLDEHISQYYHKLGWLSADDRRSYLSCSLLFSILSSGNPPYLSCNFSFPNNPRETSRASPLNLAVPSCRTSAYQQSFTSAIASFWNSLPIEIRKAQSPINFKQKLFRHLQNGTTHL
ncbi:hypothetical protein ALC60_00409 [Trachymyrmex zeteki]|uniref:RNA-directed DNA polymerase from mobile element jockey n=1 Tax=Mycetomoellerius zeteki TaxID=64791 RepID=A0A151XJM7_9HYME|nr:hypothetical protein ALC60_00409 [Trachymyrmex zeteki]